MITYQQKPEAVLYSMSLSELKQELRKAKRAKADSEYVEVLQALIEFERV